MADYRSHLPSYQALPCAARLRHLGTSASALARIKKSVPKEPRRRPGVPGPVQAANRRLGANTLERRPPSRYKIHAAGRVRRAVRPSKAPRGQIGFNETGTLHRNGAYGSAFRGSHQESRGTWDCGTLSSGSWTEATRARPRSLRKSPQRSGRDDHQHRHWRA